MRLFNLFKRTYYAILFHRRTGKELYEHNDPVCFDIYKTDWKTWYADPMVFKYERKEWLFVEKMDMMRRIGTIAVAEINANGIGEFKEVLKEGYHLSYPNVFYKDNNIYMIPESANEKAVYLYKCEKFPYQWKRFRTLLKGAYYADTNVLFHNNHWFLITGEMDPMIGSRTKLHIYNADSMEEGILFPLYSNDDLDYSFTSRGAGNFIYKNGETIRPAQVGDYRHYGKSINFYKVEFGERYSEELINSFESERISLQDKKKLSGTHTYALSDDYEIIDMQYTVIAHPIIILRTVIRKIKSKMKL